MIINNEDVTLVMLSYIESYDDLAIFLEREFIDIYGKLDLIEAYAEWYLIRIGDEEKIFIHLPSQFLLWDIWRF